MKSLPLVIATLLTLGVAPYAAAVDDSCSSAAPREETFAHPLDPERYILIDTEDPTKTGEWIDNNGRAGIQTEDCKVGAMRFYLKDIQSAVLP